jgi:prepilin-type processing-associated H-X9-DG protein
MQDHQERLPLVHPFNTKPTVATANQSWVMTVQPYIKSTLLFQCSREVTPAGLPQQRGFSDYYLNSNVAGRQSQYFRNAIVTILCGEGNDGQDQSDANYHYPAIPVAWYNNANSPLHRHDGHANYLFVDGHVKALPPTGVVTSPGAQGPTFSIR